MALHGIHCESSIELQDYPKFRKDELFFTSILSCNKKCLRKAYINPIGSGTLKMGSWKTTLSITKMK